MRPRTSAMRSVTSCRAKYTGTASSNTTVTMESPNFEMERTSWAFGTPISAVSIG